MQQADPSNYETSTVPCDDDQTPSDVRNSNVRPRLKLVIKNCEELSLVNKRNERNSNHRQDGPNARNIINMMHKNHHNPFKPANSGCTSRQNSASNSARQSIEVDSRNDFAHIVVQITDA